MKCVLISKLLPRVQDIDKHVKKKKDRYINTPYGSLTGIYLLKLNQAMVFVRFTLAISLTGNGVVSVVFMCLDILFIFFFLCLCGFTSLRLPLLAFLL